MRSLSGVSIEARIRDLYQTSLPQAAGVLHVAAVWAAPQGRLYNVLIGERTPLSETDDFALGLARARADVILTTGRILRAEPQLDFAWPDAFGGALAKWRETVCGRASRPAVAVLTRGGDLNPQHPVLQSERVSILTGRDATLPKFRDDVAVVRRESPGLLDALRFLQDQAGCSTILVEAGPSTSAALYDGKATPDELLLSVYHGDSLPDGVRGSLFSSWETFDSVGLVERSRCERREPSGRWSFHRLIRS